MPYNVGMSHPEIIIPFALPPAEHAKDLVKLLTSDCGKTGLATLLSRYSTMQRDQFDDFSLALPHEERLSKQHQYSELHYQKNRLSVTLIDGFWFLLQPIHLHIASNHLVLTDLRQLMLSDRDSRVLFQKAQELCSEAGLELVYGDAAHWFLRADAWSDFTGASPDAACGHNIDIWSPKGEQIRSWRKLQNEIQMEWFIHPIQEQRQLRGEKNINGLWLWSGCLVQENQRLVHAAQPDLNIDLQTFMHTPRLAVLNHLSSAALAGDWGTWAQKFAELDSHWFEPLCSALKSRELKTITLILTNSNGLLNLQVSSGSLRRFWRSPNFNLLI